MIIGTMKPNAADLAEWIVPEDLRTSLSPTSC